MLCSEDFFIIIISPQKYTEQSGDAVQSGDDVDQRLTSALSKPCLVTTATTTNVIIGLACIIFLHF